MFYSIHGIHTYPKYPLSGWGATLANLDRPVIWNIKHEKNRKIKKQINSTLNNLLTKQAMTRGIVNRSDLKYDEEVLVALMEQILSGSDTVKTVNILFLNCGATLKDLQKSERLLKKQLKDMDIIVDPLAYRQLEYYGSILPKPDDLLTGVLGYPMPCNTLANSFPFVIINSGIRDNGGYYLGNNLLGDTIMFDPFFLDNNRTCYNAVIFGKTGYGKSWTTYKELIHQLTKNRRVIVIDPEGEYKNICSFFDGQYLNASNGSQIRITPFHIYDNSLILSDESDHIEIDTFEMGEPLSIHLRFLTQWFRTIYKELSERELRILSAECQKVYHLKNITNETDISKLNSEDFPTMSDLYKVVCKTFEENQTIILADLKDLLKYDFLGDG